MADIKIDKNLFQERLSHFITAWKTDKRSGDALFHGVSSILVLMGKTEESAQFQKNNAIHVRIDIFESLSTSLPAIYWLENLVLAPWLRVSCNLVSDYFGWPVHRHHEQKRFDHPPILPPDLRENTGWPLTAKHLEPLKGGKIPLEILVRGKDADANTKLFEKINEQIKSAGVSQLYSVGWGEVAKLTIVDLQKKVGVLPKDTSSGPFIDEWKKVYGAISKDVEEIDIAPALSAAALAVKDQDELVRIPLSHFLSQG
jgi:nucleosome binding factor SPN SPT16 subunit